MQKMHIFVPVINESKIDQDFSMPFINTLSLMKLKAVRFWLIFTSSITKIWVLVFRICSGVAFWLWSQLIIRLFLEIICYNSFPGIFCFKLEKSYETSKENITKYCVLQVQANSSHTPQQDVLTTNCSDN